jgi:hypothetical protein
MTLPVINAVWIGRTLGLVHAACLRSFLHHGHRVVLHAFDNVEDVPAGVEVFDASRLMDRSEIVAHHETGSLSLAADIYRLRILREGMGVYVDCDVFCLKPFSADEYLFGWDLYDLNMGMGMRDLLCNAVLGLPRNSRLLELMLRAAENKYFIPPWEKPSRRKRMALRAALGFPKTLSQQRWGVIRPWALTYYAIESGVIDRAKPPDIFYFYRPTTHRPLLTDPDLKLADLVTPRSWALHLCNSGGIPNHAPPGSPLDEILSI